MNFVLSNGFLFNNNFWVNLSPLLNGNIIFFNDKKSLKKQLKSKEKLVGIGHSLGFLKLNNSGIEFDHIVGLGGFLNFCGSNERMKDIRKSELQKMILSFENDKINAIKDFYLNYDYNCDEKNYNISIEEILKDLEYMKYPHKHSGINTTIISGINDKTVPYSIIKDNFTGINNVCIKLIEEGHLLGLRSANLVANIINGISNEL